MADREELIKQFSDVTGVAEDRAKFFLEAANGELQVSGKSRAGITKGIVICDAIVRITWCFDVILF